MTCSKDDISTCCGLCDYNPVVVIATHERKEITTRNINSLKRQSFIPKIVVVCTNTDELEYYKGLKVTVIHSPNRPLGNKWQNGVNAAIKMEADPLIILGSDDILINGYIKMVLDKMREGYDFVGMTHWYTYDLRDTYHCQYTNSNVDFPIGSGRAYSKKALLEIRKIFDTDAERKLDDVGFRRVCEYNMKSHLFRDPYILAVKGNWEQMNPISGYLHSRNINAVIGKYDLSEFT